MYFIEKTTEFDKWLKKNKGFQDQSENSVQAAKN